MYAVRVQLTEGLVRWNGQSWDTANVWWSKVSIETHIFNFNRDIYGDELTIAFVERIRAEKRFDSVSELRGQLLADKERVLQILHP